MKDKKTIIGILLIVVIMVAWGIWMQPSKEQREKQKAKMKHEADSINQAKRDQQIKDSIDYVNSLKKDTVVIKDSTILNLPDSLQKVAMDSIEMANAKASLGGFADNINGEEKIITVETEKFLLTFSTKGGIISRCQMLGFQTYKDRFVKKNDDTLDLWIPGSAGYSSALILADQQKMVETGKLYFSTNAKSTKIKGEEKAVLSFKIFANNDSTKYLEYLYTIPGNNYMINFDINSVGLDKVIDPNQGDISFAWAMTAPSQERKVSKERESTNIYFRDKEGEVSQMKGGVKGKKNVEVKHQMMWLSFKQQFFSTTLIPENGFKDNYLNVLSCDLPENKQSEDINKEFLANVAIPYNNSSKESFKMRMYLGPNHRNTLVKYDAGLQKQIDLGYMGFLNKWLIIPVFNFFAGKGWNYGLIILMLTIIIKLITVPLTYKTFVSSAKMRLLKPDIDALSEKFKPEEAMAKQQAVMQLYRKAGVSPLSGCIPALLQMPILFAMLAFFPAAFELRQAGLFWANDLSTYDSIVSWNANIPIISSTYGNHVSLFALLMTITTIFYTKMNSGQMTAQGGIQAQQMKIMMYLMPVVFLVFLNSYSAALSYYYFLSNIISILLMLFIRRFMIDEKKLHAQIEENKKKTPKKSKWMQRMEDIQKVRQEQMRQQQKGGKKK